MKTKKTRTNYGPQNFNKEELIGVSKHHHDILELINHYAQTDKNILIIGDTGTGKELIAKQLHKESGRAGAFIPFNAAAIPETLFESEFFGYKKGSHSTANIDKKGLAESADNGTLFIDEIGKMPLSCQGKLLRFIEDKKITPLGGRDSIPVNVRILAALKPGEENDEKNFLSDLGHRLRQCEIKTLPLRERQEDVIAILHHYTEGKIDPRVKAYIYSIELRGNARELKTLSGKEYWEIEKDVDEGLRHLYPLYDDLLGHCQAYEICTLKANGVSNDAIAEAIHCRRERLTKIWLDSYGISLDDFIGRYDITQNRLFYPNFIENAGFSLQYKAAKVRPEEK